MVAVELAFSLTGVLDAVDRGLDGALVECRTWLSKASLAMLLAQRYGFERISESPLRADLGSTRG